MIFEDTEDDFEYGGQAMWLTHVTATFTNMSASLK